MAVEFHFTSTIQSRLGLFSLYIMFSLSNQSKGTLYTVIGVLAVTPNSLLIRKVSHLPLFTVQFYSYLFFFAAIAIVYVLQQGRDTPQRFKDIGYVGWVAGLVYGASNVLLTLAFQKTAAATALVILASSPMFSALFSFFILKEIIPIHTILASLVCFGAIVLIFATQLGNGCNSSDDTEGIVYALLCAMCLAAYFVIISFVAKDGETVDMMPCTIIAGAFATFVSICNNPDLSTVSGMDWLYLVLNGALVLGISQSMWTIGPSLITAPEVSLYTLIETVLGPVWVWLGGYEAPPRMSVYGGVALIVALAIHSVISIREEARKQKVIDANNQAVKEEEQSVIACEAVMVVVEMPPIAEV